jgi:hypothetical protein
MPAPFSGLTGGGSQVSELPTTLNSSRGGSESECRERPFLRHVHLFGQLGQQGGRWEWLPSGRRRRLFLQAAQGRQAATAYNADRSILSKQELFSELSSATLQALETVKLPTGWRPVFEQNEEFAKWWGKWVRRLQRSRANARESTLTDEEQNRR